MKRYASVVELRPEKEAEYLKLHNAVWPEVLGRLRETQRWWKLTAPCPKPVPTAGEGELWAEMEEVFHAD